MFRVGRLTVGSHKQGKKIFYIFYPTIRSIKVNTGYFKNETVGTYKEPMERDALGRKTRCYSQST